MKYPIWILNSTLLGLCAAAVIFIFISQQPIPRIVSLAPQEVITAKKEISKIDITKIYTDDLFGTYQEPTTPTESAQAAKVPMPQPPQPRPVIVPLAQPSRFLDPLPITLRGVMALSDEEDNVALVEDNQTKATKNYKIGDKIVDGYVVRIARNRLTILRSNGQQETLYVTADDPELTKLLARTDWTSVVQKQSATNYLINPYEFVNHIPSVANLIDTFNLTTVYQQGQSIGCRVGIIEQNTLAEAMGLRHGDIITAINDIPAFQTADRLKIYQQIRMMQPNDIITLSIQRAKQEITISYTLQDFANKQEQAATPAPGAQTGQQPPSSFTGISKSSQEIQKEKERILQERYKFAPTVRDLRTQDRQTMNEYNANARRSQGSLLGALPES